MSTLVYTARKQKVRSDASVHSLPQPRGLSRILRYHLAVIPTAWGVCGVVWREFDHPEESFPTGFIEKAGTAVLCQIMTPGLPVSELRSRMLKKYAACGEVLGDRLGNFHPEVVPEWFGGLSNGLRAYYADGLRNRGEAGIDFSDSWNFWRSQLDWSQLTGFQRSVLETVAAIPRSYRMTYGEVARKIGKSKASRAVGAALGANPWPVLIPCHRVVGANGTMTGFSAPGGVGVKRRMLSMEER